MNPDIPNYLTLTCAALVGLIFAIRKAKKPAAAVLIPFAGSVLVLTGASAVLYASQTDFTFLILCEEKTIDGVIPMIVGAGLLLGMISMIAGSIYAITRLAYVTFCAKRNTK